MPTEETEQNTQNEPGGETPPAKEPTVTELQQMLEASNKDREAARLDAVNARRESEGAQAYLQNLLGTMRTAAEAGNRGAAPVDERTLAEKLSENPEGVLDEHFRARMGPIVNAYLQNQDLQNRELAKERMLRDDSLKDAEGVSFWTKYEKEVDQFMAGMPAEIRARPGTYERALKFVMAEHIDEVADAKAARIAKQREARERGAFVEGPTGAAPRTRQPEGLTSLEKEIAKGLGMTEKAFLDAKKVDQFGNTGG